MAIALGSLRPRQNTGIIALALAYAVGLYAGMSVKEISLGMPTSLIATLVGVMLLFGIARQSGALDRVVRFSLAFTQGNSALVPFVFFFFTFVLAAIGPGNIAATALVAPIGMAIAARTGVSSMLMAIAICTGANAGAFSPLSPTGIINASLMRQIGVDDDDLALWVFAGVALIQSVSALGAYLIFGGFRTHPSYENDAVLKDTSPERFTAKQITALVAIAFLVVGVILFKFPVSAGAFALTMLLTLFNIGDVEVAIKALPWNVILLVTGVSVLIGVMEKTGGIDLATSLIASISARQTINATLALITGFVSVYSSSSAVVLPSFLPLIPGLIQKLGGGNIVKMIIAIDVGSHMVDVSPLSSLGALCLAAASSMEDKAKLYRQLLIWGFAMAFVGAALAFIFLDLL